MTTTMQTLLGPPVIPLDPKQCMVTLELADAQAIASYLKLQPLGDALDIFAPLATGIRNAMTIEQKQVLEAVGKSAVEQENERRAKVDKEQVEVLEPPAKLIDEPVLSEEEARRFRMMRQAAATQRAAAQAEASEKWKAAKKTGKPLNPVETIREGGDDESAKNSARPRNAG